MSMIKTWFRNWMLDDGRNVNEAPTRASVSLDDRPVTTVTRSFTINEAMNGTFIAFNRRKYNPNGPDERRNEIYLVQPGESLIDAISTVLVLTEK